MCEGNKQCDTCAAREKNMRRSKALCSSGDGPSVGCPAPIEITAGKDMTDQVARGRRGPARRKATEPEVRVVVRAKNDGRELGTFKAMPWTLERMMGDEARERGDEAEAKRHDAKAKALYEASFSPPWVEAAKTGDYVKAKALYDAHPKLLREGKRYTKALQLAEMEKSVRGKADKVRAKAQAEREERGLRARREAELRLLEAELDA